MTTFDNFMIKYVFILLKISTFICNPIKKNNNRPPKHFNLQNCFLTSINGSWYGRNTWL